MIATRRERGLIQSGLLTLALLTAGGVAMGVGCTSGDGGGNGATPPTTTATPTSPTSPAAETCATAPEAAAPLSIDPNVAAGTAALQAGQNTFRFDTFGDEAFWGDTLKLHQAIEGKNHGGVGDGVSPKTALAVGLKVDATAVPANVAVGSSPAR